MTARWFAFVIWAAVAAMAAFWGLRLTAFSPSVPLHAATVDTVSLPRAELTRLFGADNPPPSAVEAVAPVDTRYKLIGVVASSAALANAEGLAIIAVDGKPARAYRVGAVVDGDTVLQEVRPRAALLGPRGGAAALTMNLAPVPAAATGSLPIGAGAGAGAAQPNAQPAAPFNPGPGAPVYQPVPQQAPPPAMPSLPQATPPTMPNEGPAPSPQLPQG